MDGLIASLPLRPLGRSFDLVDMVLHTLLGMSETACKLFTDNNTTVRNGS
jgi:hypothetical protein